MKANFEEKSYESYFNSELSSLSEVYFAPGQATEGYFGFDVAAFSLNRRLWRRLGHPFWIWPPFSGTDLASVTLEMERFHGEVLDDLPQIRCNLLFQYKRPERMERSTSSEWKHWHVPYFRYDVDQNQQKLLEAIHHSFAANVLVAYAAPATVDVNRLVQCSIERSIINNSNFKKAADLSGHRRNTYVHAGTHSVACSEPKTIRNIDLLETIEQLKQETSLNSNLTNRQLIKEFVNGVRCY